MDLTKYSETQLLEFVLEILSQKGPVSEVDRTSLYLINLELKRRENVG